MRKSKRPPSRSCVRAFQVSFLPSQTMYFLLTSVAEEFTIYMNYVRKLGFEETPDYDFLRELFTKVLKTLNEPEDGVFDWMSLNGGKGWEANNVGSRPPSRIFGWLANKRKKSPQHASASSAATPHRETRRERDHGRRSRQVQDGTTPNQLVLSPAPVHQKNSRRTPTGDRGGNTRDLGSVQPLAPNSRRGSQQHRDISGINSAALTAPHPYATAPSPTGYRTATTPNTYDRHSPNPPHLHPNGNGHLNGSESFLYGQAQAGKNGSGEGTTNPGQREMGGQVRGMGMYDRDQMQRVGEQDEDGGHHRPRGFFSILCCRG